jgi:deoxycytidine triphosphate deaminase
MLRDEELVQLLQGQPPIVTINNQPLNLPNPYAADSPVQPSSVDLHVGNIYLPGVNDGLGCVGQPMTEYDLAPGGTAVVMTREELSLPGNLAAFGFPPSKVSIEGVLMTNPGHVDPGYRGPLHFTVINMGIKAYTLGQETVIVTLLFFQLPQPAHVDWLVRHNQQAGGPVNQAVINRLSPDFLDVKKRSEDIANEIADRKLQWTAIISTVTAIISAAIVAVGGWLITGANDARVSDLASSLNSITRRWTPSLWSPGNCG